MNVLDCLAGLAKAGKIDAAMADEAAAVYRAALVDMDPSAAALKTADFLRGKAKARRASVDFCIADPDKIPDVAAAMREQWREAQAGRKPN